MKVFAKILKYSLIIIIVLMAGFLFVEKTDISTKEYFQKIFPCSSPLEFSIGKLDLQFNLTREEVIALSQEAGNIWSQAASKSVLVYNPEAPFKINLIFDERQAATTEAAKLEGNLNDLKLSQEELEKKYESAHSSYNQKVSAYEKAAAEYEKKLAEYNEDVAYWNKKGGAPEEEYEKLEDEKEELKDLYDSLEKQRKEINSLAGKTGALASEEKTIVSKYNASVNTYKNKYGDAREFEKGIFAGEEINIYQFKEKADLELTLVHELGHYLGLDHTENSQSIMYYLIGDQDMENLTLTQEDLTELKRMCKIR